MPTQPLQLKNVMLCGAAIVMLSMGIRHGFGFWLQPMIQANGWGRETFAFALALQNLTWGVCQAFAGGMADRFGAMKVLWLGAALYAAGLVSMALATTGLGFALSAGVLLGMAQSCTTYSVVYSVLGRVASAEKRAWAMGMVAAVGSFGQFAFVPADQVLISWLGWQQALFVLAGLVLLIAPLSLGLNETPVQNDGNKQSVGEALKEAFKTPSFLWLMAGYFVCGFQVVFIGVHLPSYLRDKGFEPSVAVVALALIGLFNIFGTYYAGVLGSKFPKKYLLSANYSLRAVVIALFLLAPLSNLSVWIFSAAMGVLWLSTVPPTNGIVATVFGVKYLGMLSGLVFLLHQVGSFAGAWLGGYLYDKTGSYNVVWGIAIGLGFFAGLVHLPIKEKPLVRLQTA